jgi:hypothetical protein
MRLALRCNHSGCFCKGARANVHCPAHHDPDPSLSVPQAPEGDGKATQFRTALTGDKYSWKWEAKFSNASGDVG